MDKEPYLYEYSSIPDAEIMLVFLKPSIQKFMPFLPDLTGDSGAKVESDKIVQESAPLARIGIVAALRELLFPICDRFLWYLKQINAEIAKTTPITTPIEIPIINPVDSSFISPSFSILCSSSNPFTYLPKTETIQSYKKKHWIWTSQFQTISHTN